MIIIKSWVEWSDAHHFSNKLTNYCNHPKGDDFMYNYGESYSEYDISLSDNENYDDGYYRERPCPGKFSAMIIVRIMMRRHLIMH